MLTYMIQIENLVKLYGEKSALEGISFNVGEGEIVGFLGPNGAGKSTTMNILTGYLSATAGTVKVGGIDVFEFPDEAKKKIGFLPEQPPVYNDMKVSEYLNFVYEIKKCKLNRRKHLAEIMQVTKIHDVSDRIIGNLSKGYRQRVGIAQALVGNPPVIIFDEPTVGLDPKQIIEIRSLIKTLGKHHTVILSSHILSEIEAVCDRVIIINKGELVADDSAENLSAQFSDDHRLLVRIAGPAKESTALVKGIGGVISVTDAGSKEVGTVDLLVETAPNADIRRDLFERLAQRGWPLLYSKTQAMSLEDIFIDLTQKKGGAR